MNAPATSFVPMTPGTPYAGGFFVDTLLIAGVLHALILAPKAEGRHAPAEWNKTYKRVDGALSFDDGLANTKAMAESGSELAKWALGLAIGGLNDWYIPAVDELERVYRALKPTKEENSSYMRSGINIHATPPAAPYSVAPAVQTLYEAFKEGGAEAIDSEYHWTSTQNAHWDGCAWAQHFGDGLQHGWSRNNEFPALVLRREIIR